MANNYRTQITPKGVESIFRQLCVTDPRIQDFRLSDFAETDMSSEDQYPLVMFEIVDSNIIEKNSLHYTEWNVRLYCFTMRRKDFLNTTDAFSETHVILNDVVLRFRKESQFREWGFIMGTGPTSFDYVLREDRDDLIGTSADIKFSTPLMLCLGDFPVDSLPDVGLFYSASTISSDGGHTLIQNGVNTYTGGTSSRPTVNVVDSPSFVSISADTIYSGGTDLSILLSGGSASDLESVLSIGNEATNDIILKGTGERLLAFRDEQFTGNTDASIGINPSIYGEKVLRIFSPGNIDHVAPAPVSPSLNFPIDVVSNNAYHHAFYHDRDQTLVDPAIIAFVSGDTASGEEISSSFYLSTRNQRTYQSRGVLLVATGTTAIGYPVSKVNLPFSSGTLALQTEIIPTYVQQGTNTTTGGTATRPTVNVVDSPSFVSVSATTFYSGATELSTLLTGGSRSLTVRTTTATTLSLALTDANNYIISSASTSVLALIPTNSSVAFPIGTQIMFEQGSTGQLRFSASTGTVLQSYGSAYNVIGQYATAVLTKKATDTWNIDGNLTTLSL